jgi:hypothetical protein
LHATGMFHTTATRNNARTSGSWGWVRAGPKKEDQEIERALHDPGADLLIAAQRTAAKLHHLEAEALGDEPACRLRRVQLVPGQQRVVERDPLMRAAFLLSCAIGAIHFLRAMGIRAEGSTLGIAPARGHIRHGLFPAADAQFVVDRLQRSPDGRLEQHQPEGDLSDAESRGETAQHLELAWREEAPELCGLSGA